MDLKKIEGLRTIEEIEELLSITHNYALKLVYKLRKQGYLRSTGGGKQKRIYKITTYKQTQSNGMFDIINKYSNIKVQPVFKHITTGKYTEEDALIDAIKLKNRRTLLASLSLFNHIKDWRKLSALARKYKIGPQLGCLYGLARTAIKTRRMPENINNSLKRNIPKITAQLSDEKSDIINKEWNCAVPFSKEDLERLK